jgi:phosphoribosylamine--glycine ligase
MKVLVVGGGGREHCLAWKFSQSSLVEKVYCAPGNGGTNQVSENVPISPTDIPGLIEFVKRQKIDLTVVGPELPLSMGIVDAFNEAELKIFGPTKDAAQLESSKIFTRELCKEVNVPQPNFDVFSTAEEAKEFVKNNSGNIVVKADGLASGKGVTVCSTEEEAFGAIDSIMVKKTFGDAGRKILLEEKLVGQEASFLCFVDGKKIVPLVSAQDHKPIFDGDLGPNTGGMGAYSPTPFLNFDQENKVLEEIVKPTVSALKEKGTEYKGILYAGLMLNEGKAKLIEFNCRFGDPETQVILPRLKSDFILPILGCVNGSLRERELEWKDLATTCVILSSQGYPGKYETGKEIRGLDIVRFHTDSMVFHSGTKTSQGKTFTNGGRVLNVVGMGKNVRESISAAYKAVNKIKFNGMYYRKDIGQKALR